MQAAITKSDNVGSCASRICSTGMVPREERGPADYGLSVTLAWSGGLALTMESSCRTVSPYPLPNWALKIAVNAPAA